MRRAHIVLTLLALAGPALAQGTPPPAAAPAPAAGLAPGAPNPVVAKVDGDEIRLSDLVEAADTLPDQLRSTPPQVLLPMILDQLIAQKALVAQARRQGLDKDEEVRRRIQRAEEQELQQAMVQREVLPMVTEDAVKARYDRDIANRPPEEEVHARHILVASEAEAKQVLAEVRRPGANFADIAKRRSADPGASNGGDLGFFKKGDMVPEFANAAFALKPGEISAAPVQSPFGWHIIKVEERRTAPPPRYEEVRDQLRSAMLEEAVGQVVERAKATAQVQRFNLDGSPVGGATPPAPGSLLNGAQPPAPASPPAPARR
ncbi:peptidylprolyl isomerase [Acetobacteraceae bacterium H6797]|nr:peptidylprolyl isomerase [Acetobacteraceae bacterium H6797]